MKEVITKDTQNKLYQYLYPILDNKLEQEYDTRREKITKEAAKKYLNNKEVTDYIANRKLEFNLVIKLVAVWKELDEQSKELMKEAFFFSHYQQIQEYVNNEDLFILKYNDYTDNTVASKCENLLEKELGITRNKWIAVRDLEIELEARLAIQPLASFNEIVDKITKDIVIENFLNK